MFFVCSIHISSLEWKVWPTVSTGLFTISDSVRSGFCGACQPQILENIPNFNIFARSKVYRNIAKLPTFSQFLLYTPQTENPGGISDYKVFRTSIFNKPHRIYKLTTRKQTCVLHFWHYPRCVSKLWSFTGNHE